MRATVFTTGRFRAKLLQPETDNAAVDDLSQRCADYALMLTGQPPDRDASAAFFAAVPDGKTLADMWKLGVFDSAGKLVALADVAREHPAPGTWYIGLLLIDPTVRGRGVGAAVVRGVKQEAARNGAVRLMLSVVTENERALKFWKTQGFSVTRDLPPKRFGRKQHARVELVANVRC